ncbi:hypothetical protein IQ06DRAFT_116577 [Phaeosphaeriaceae sp. SRC1lsM3a]|nr:hypothetical protein IQ06DRAFT_116577 [Stagonospora sp. SRC1lsM3a]
MRRGAPLPNIETGSCDMDQLCVPCQLKLKMKICDSGKATRWTAYLRGHIVEAHMPAAAWSTFRSAEQSWYEQFWAIFADGNAQQQAPMFTSCWQVPERLFDPVALSSRARFPKYWAENILVDPWQVRLRFEDTMPRRTNLWFNDHRMLPVIRATSAR